MKRFFGGRSARVWAAGAALWMLAAGGVMAGSGGNVMPANAKQKGYSLSDAASATAVFNTGGTTTPQVPFLILTGGAGSYSASPGTMLYVPVFFADDSGVPDPAPFPTNLGNNAVVSHYLISAVDAFTGLTNVAALFITVDGNTTVLGPEYTVGVTTSPLADGGGTHYIVGGAFLTPLTPGVHQVVVGAVLANGALIGPPGYTVTVGK